MLTAFATTQKLTIDFHSFVHPFTRTPNKPLIHPPIPRGVSQSPGKTANPSSSASHNPQVPQTQCPLTQVRKKLIEIFPSKILNPNSECPITITLFPIGSGTDFCTVHKLYVRGHEIASGGMNRTGMVEDWMSLEWDNQIGALVAELLDKAYLPGSHVRGARAPLQKPGGDEMFSMLYDKGFMYDSTLLAGPGKLGSGSILPWPVTLDVPYSPRYQCLTPKCPKRSFPGLWEVPLVRLVNPELNRICAYLDDCLVTMKSPDDVYKLLYRNFHQHYETNR